MARPTNEMRASGKCYRCGKSRADGHAHCLDCLRMVRVRLRDYRRGRDAERKAAGLCVKCAAPTGGPAHCPACLAKRKKVTRDLVRDGRCLQCREPAGEFKYCRSCLGKFSDRHRAFALRLKLEVFGRYGGARCACCGETDEVFLNIDHVGGGGANHRREVLKGKGGEALYRWLKANGFPAGYRVLCFNCNFAVHRLGRCPHEDETCGDPDFSSASPSGCSAARPPDSSCPPKSQC